MQYVPTYRSRRTVRQTAVVALALTFGLALLAPHTAHAQDAPATTAAATPNVDDRATALLQAIVQGDTAAVKAALDQGADINRSASPEFDNLPPLHLAAYLGRNEIARLLLERGADPKQPGPENWNVLSFVIFNHNATMRQMEQASKMQGQLTAQMQGQIAAAQAALPEAAKMLDQIGPDGRPKQRKQGFLGRMLGGGGLSSLMMAAATGGTSLIGQGLLKQVGMDLGKQVLGKALGNSPLGNFAQAVLSGNPLSGATALESLAGGKAGALGDAGSWVQMVQSAAKGNPASITGLMKMAPAPGATADPGSWGTFLNAAQAGRLEEAKQILKSGKIQGYLQQSQDSVKNAFQMMETEMRSRSARYSAAPSDPAAEAALMQLLLEKGADPNTRDGMGATPLMWSAQNGRADLAKVLLEKGAQVNLKDEQGMTALDYADMNLASLNLGGEGDAPENPVVKLLEKAGGKSGS